MSWNMGVSWVLIYRESNIVDFIVSIRVNPNIVSCLNFLFRCICRNLVYSDSVVVKKQWRGRFQNSAHVPLRCFYTFMYPFQQSYSVRYQCSARNRFFKGIYENDVSLSNAIKQGWDSEMTQGRNSLAVLICILVVQMIYIRRSSVRHRYHKIASHIKAISVFLCVRFMTNVVDWMLHVDENWGSVLQWQKCFNQPQTEAAITLYM